MGSCLTKIEREEMVTRCRGRKRYMKTFVEARQALSSSHTMYLRSLKATGSALLQFATAETPLHHPVTAPPVSVPGPQQPPMSPTSWGTSTTVSSSAVRPPPPPPPVQGSWDFWDPFMPASSPAATEEDWEETTATMSEVVMTPVRATAPEPAAEMAVVVSAKSKELVEIIKELDEYFLRAAGSGNQLSSLLEVPSFSFSDQRSTGKVYGYGKSLSPLLWTWGSSSSKMDGFGKFNEEVLHNNLNGSHCSTVERLYAWEKKLYLEVKNAETLKMEHEKRVKQLRRLEMKRADYIKTEKSKKEVEKLESRMMVASQGIETTSAEIIKLRESELYPQLVELVKGFMCMWRSMYECHQVQMHIVQQLKYLNTTPSNNPTSEIHRQSTLQLELEVQQWHISFCNIVKAQREYIQSLSGWLRLSLFQFNDNSVSKTKQDSAIYSLCEEWHLAIDHAPDKVASEGINSLLTVIHGIVVQQAEEHKQKKKSESVFKEFEKKTSELRALESKYGPFSMPDSSGAKNPVADKRAKVAILRVKSEDERAKYEKAVSVTRSMTLNNLQMGLPHVFQAVTGFANVWMHAFESVYNQGKAIDELHNVKMILPR
ncbi:hypothetical protein ACET3Z_015462 [Daucus carota]